VVITIVFTGRTSHARRHRATARRIARPGTDGRTHPTLVYVIIDETDRDSYGLGGNPLDVTLAKVAQR